MKSELALQLQEIQHISKFYTQLRSDLNCFCVTIYHLKKINQNKSRPNNFTQSHQYDCQVPEEP